MKIYTAIWEDKHNDTTVHLFSDKDVAIEWARDTAKEYCRYEESYNEEDCPEGWLFRVVYSCEHDGIHVVECEVDSELET